MGAMHESILIKDIPMMLPEGERRGDLFIRDGKIEAIGPSLNPSAELEIRESGLTLLPGIIDTHVHFREPGATHKEDIESGSRAAAGAGVTTFFDMPNTSPSTLDSATLDQKFDIASKTSYINYQFYIGASKENIDQLPTMREAAAIKLFRGSSTGNLLVDDPNDLERLFSQGTMRIAVHSEDEAMVLENNEKYLPNDDVKTHMKIRSPEAALSSTKQLVALAKKHNRRLHILHITTAEETEYLSTEPAVQSGLVTAEACIPHLFFSAPEAYDTLGTLAQVNPPIRDARHRERIWKGLHEGTIKAVTTDHAPHLLSEKAASYPKAPSGMPTIDVTVPAMLNEVNKGHITLEQLVQWMCVAPAQCLGIQNKGQIKAGFDADLILVDMTKQYTIENKNIRSRAGWTAFDGMPCQGQTLATICNGQIVFREGDFFEKMGRRCEIRHPEPVHS